MLKPNRFGIIILICLTFVGCDAFRKTKKFEVSRDAVTKISKGYKGKEHLFVLDKSTPALGEAWMDESGMVWGDILKTTDGSIHYLNYEEATAYCAKLGAKLPSEDDFSRLRNYMGAEPDLYEGYSPQILPNLYRQKSNQTLNNFFWSSTTDWLHYHLAYVFGGKLGGFGLVNRLFADDFTTARCVKQL